MIEMSYWPIELPFAYIISSSAMMKTALFGTLSFFTQYKGWEKKRNENPSLEQKKRCEVSLMKIEVVGKLAK